MNRPPGEKSKSSKRKGYRDHLRSPTMSSPRGGMSKIMPESKKGGTLLDQEACHMLAFYLI